MALEAARNERRKDRGKPPERARVADVGAGGLAWRLARSRANASGGGGVASLETTRAISSYARPGVPCACGAPGTSTEKNAKNAVV